MQFVFILLRSAFIGFVTITYSIESFNVKKLNYFLLANKLAQLLIQLTICRFKRIKGIMFFY